jgi:hypothetical protein
LEVLALAGAVRMPRRAALRVSDAAKMLSPEENGRASE